MVVEFTKEQLQGKQFKVARESNKFTFDFTKEQKCNNPVGIHYGICTINSFLADGTWVLVGQKPTIHELWD